MKLIIGDTETASLQGGICDIALIEIDENLNVLWEVESLIDPERPISPSASAIHHITDDMVTHEPTLSEFMGLHNHPLACDDLVIIGHNIQFDCRMLAAVMPPQYQKLCTLKLARTLWPDNENHQLQTLRYQFKLDAGTAHRALGDCYAVLSLLRMVAEDKGMNVLGIMDLCRAPLGPDFRLPFGKHKGTKLKDVPRSYVHWMLHKSEMELDPELRQALEAL